MLIRAIALVCLVFVGFPSDALSQEKQFLTTSYEFPFYFDVKLCGGSKNLRTLIAISTQKGDFVMRNVKQNQYEIIPEIKKAISPFNEEDLLGDDGLEGRTDLSIAIRDTVNAKLEQLVGVGGISDAQFTHFQIGTQQWPYLFTECSQEHLKKREKQKAEAQEKRNALVKAEEKRKAEALIAAQKRAEEANKLIAVGSGSSFAVNAEGTFISNQHVIDGCSNIELMKSGKPHEAAIVASDKRNDLALIQVSDPINQEVFFRLSEEPIKVMDDVFVGGYPFGNLLGKNVKVTSGIVSSMAGIDDDVSQLMIDAAIQPGNSGGPIFLTNGKLAAVTVASLDSLTILKVADALPQNTNFGIKLSVLREFLSANNVTIPEQSFFTRDFERDDLVNEAILQVICYARKGDVQKLKQRKVLFDALMKE